MPTFNQFLAEIKSDMNQYFETGLINDVSVYKWVNKALKKFGSTIMIYHEAVIEVENNKGVLPDNFYSLKHALKCDKDFIECSKDTEPILLRSAFWNDIQLKQKEWNVCTDECVSNCVQEFTIRDKTYIDGAVFNRYYKAPVELRLSKTFKKSLCDNECFNKYSSESPYEININGNTLYTNFKQGDVYIKYKGLELDEEGLVIIPDTPKGELDTYISYHVKRNILEIAKENKDDANISDMLKYYLGMENQALALALTEVKFSNLTPSSLYKLRLRNQLERKKFERIPRR